MFEIGNTLRDARVRLALELEDVAQATRISARILAALEEERFERLPGDFYARSYLRTYADFLGLESGRFLDEYRERFPEQEPLPLQGGGRRRFTQMHKRALLILSSGPRPWDSSSPSAQDRSSGAARQLRAGPTNARQEAAPRACCRPPPEHPWPDSARAFHRGLAR